jgi:hypothetical protein
MSTEISVTVHVSNVAHLHDTAQALADKGMCIHFRSRRADGGRVFGSISILRLPDLTSIDGCRVVARK